MAVASLCEGKGYDEPPNCRRLECPTYQVIHTRKDYEIRSYNNAMWMSSPLINSTSYTSASDAGFLILFAYILGKNLKAAKIEMTTPVLVDINPSTSSKSSYGVHFYLPQKYRNSPPLSNQARPMMLPTHKYAAVRRFGGFMNDSNITPQVMALMQSLKGTSWASASSQAAGPGDTSPIVPYTVAAYNSPYEKDHRVNEVLLWFDKN